MKIEEPVKFDFRAMTENSFPHIIVVAEAKQSDDHRKLRIERGKKYFTNSAIQIFVEDNAHLTHYRVQTESAESFTSARPKSV